MKRIIIDYKKLTPELAAALLEKYPQGYGDDDILSFRNARGEWIQAVELQTPEALCLVKIGKDLNRLISHFDRFEEEEQHEPEDSFESEFDNSFETDEADLQFEED